MKYECDMIEDLLPLYSDGACSASSSKAVEEHIAECSKCRQLLEQLKDVSVDELLHKEKEDVIVTQSRYFKRKSALAGSIIAAVFAIPILICLIVNLVTGNGLDWFFVVLAAMAIPTSLFVVPLMAPENRMFLTMCSLTGSIILLLAVCCIYTGGNWFFVAAASTLFGLTVCFGPFIACRRPVNAYLGNHKGLAVMGACTVTFFLMMVCIGIYVSVPGYYLIAFGISVPIVALVWIMFLVIRYLPVHGLAKAGVIVLLTGLVSLVCTWLIPQLMIRNAGENEVVVYTDSSDLYTLIAAIVGAILMVIGLLVGKNKKSEVD